MLNMSANESKPTNRAVKRGQVKTRNLSTSPADEATAPVASPARVRVRVGPQPIMEGGLREPGEIFQTTPERAAALGALVKLLQ